MDTSALKKFAQEARRSLRDQVTAKLDLVLAQGSAASLPARAKKPVRPSRTGAAYVLLDEAGRVLLLRRPDKGLLGGMLALPETAPMAADWRHAGSIAHVFTHFSLTLEVHVARVQALPAGISEPAATAPLPSVMRKALNRGLSSLERLLTA